LSVSCKAFVRPDDDALNYGGGWNGYRP
jgi:hypothetical protein